MAASVPLRALARPSPSAEDPDREALFAEWLPVVLRWCGRLGGPRIDAEDAAHDVMVTVFTRMHTVRDPGAFPSWVFGVTRRTLAWHRRKAWVRRWVPGLEPTGVAPGEGPEGEASSRELGQRVQEGLEQLSSELREVLILCDLEDRTDDEVAVILGIPAGTVKSRLRRARRQFATIAAASGLGPEPVAASEEP